jgi:uncharacterized phiE125 gp8 family phage protein
MTEKLKTPPTELAVTIADARANLRVDGADLDPLISLWVQGITAVLEHEIGQKVMPQTWLWIDDAFPDAIRLPHPVRSIVAVKFRDVAGVEQILDPADYVLDVQRYQSWLVPAAGKSWPATFDQVNAVSVEVVCGMAENAAELATVAPNVRLYVLAKLCEQFDPITRAERETVQSAFVDRLLDACKSYS